MAFALRYGGDPGTAWIWPLIVDGMLTAGTVVLWITRHNGKGRGRWVAWVTFGVGIALSLSANITAAPELSLFAIMVTGCPPVALLLLIELLNYVLTHHHTENRNSGENVLRFVDTCTLTFQTRILVDPLSGNLGAPQISAAVPGTAWTRGHSHRGLLCFDVYTDWYTRPYDCDVACE